MARKVRSPFLLRLNFQILNSWVQWSDEWKKIAETKLWSVGESGDFFRLFIETNRGCSEEIFLSHFYCAFLFLIYEFDRMQIFGHNPRFFGKEPGKRNERLTRKNVDTWCWVHNSALKKWGLKNDIWTG